MCAVLSAPTFLPAVLALLDRSAYRPARPKASDTSVEGRGVWRRVAAAVDRGDAPGVGADRTGPRRLRAFARPPRAGHRRARRTGAGRKIVVVLKKLDTV
ncbi:hypothetical protein GCM10010524_07010 [Streptomyces mexicanus]